jgi:hypothetical protein
MCICSAAAMGRAIPVADNTAARREEARIERLARPAKLALLTSAEAPA